MRRHLVLIGIMACCAFTVVSAGGGIEITVKVPGDSAVTMRTDSGPQRVEITDGGAYVSVYNLTFEDTFTITKNPSLPRPQVKICNNTGEDGLRYEFFDCPDGDCVCPPGARTGVVSVELDDGECYEDTQLDCYTQIVGG